VQLGFEDIEIKRKPKYGRLPEFKLKQRFILRNILKSPKNKSKSASLISKVQLEDAEEILE
jgi:hypothetical protein